MWMNALMNACHRACVRARVLMRMDVFAASLMFHLKYFSVQKEPLTCWSRWGVHQNRSHQQNVR